MPTSDPDLFFWYVVTRLIVGACAVLIVSAALGLAVGFVKGAFDADDDDVAAPAAVSDVSSRSDPGDRSAVDPEMSDLRDDLAWLRPRSAVSFRVPAAKGITRHRARHGGDA